MFTNHTDLLNYLAITFNLNSYLELGVQNKANNFNKIICKEKTGVDPDLMANADFVCASDYFFEHCKNPKTEYDLIFIDGYHEQNQVKHDFENSLSCLSDEGFIIIHDTCPEKEEHTHVPRDSRVWNGDVWKFAVTLGQIEGIEFCTLDFDHGCTVVWKSKKSFAHNMRLADITWETFQKSKKYLLQIISEKRFINEMMSKIDINIDTISSF